MKLLIYILLYISSVFAHPNNNCGPGNILDQNCYSILPSKMSYLEAKAKCQKSKGVLAEITNQRTLDFLSTMVSTISRNQSTDSLWIGLDSQRVDGSWSSGKSRLNRYHYNRPHVSCTRLDMRSLKAAQISCGHLLYPLCQYQTPNCSIGDLSIPYSNFGICNANQTFVYNTTLKVNCLNGYILQGPDKVTCQANGSWSHIPNCMAKCLPPLVGDGILIHDLKPEYNIGEEVLLLCQNGYFPGGKYIKSHRVATCTREGKWSNLNVVCIHEDQLNCPSEVCQTMQLHVEQNETVTLNCTGSDAFGVDIWPHFHWLKDHDKPDENNQRIKIRRDGFIEIRNFQVQDKGMYTCVRGLNENHVEKVVVYDVRLKYKCDIDPNRNLPTIIVPEETSVYLKSKGDGSAFNVAWFKNGRRIWGDKKRIVLPSGDLLIHRTKYSDEGYFTFEIESDTYTDMCMDRTVKLSIIPRSSSICGLAERAHPHPWLASLWWNQETSPFCYGVLINEQWVLTSAFCLSRFYRFKNHNVSVKFDQQGKNVLVERFVVHPFYSKRLNVNDIGLLKLVVPVVFSDSVRPICLPKIDLSESGQPCNINTKILGNVSGLGGLDALNSRRVVQKELMALVNKKQCEGHMVFKFPDTMFCAELDEKENAVFAADIGSPFELGWEDRTYVFGVYSWGQRLSQVGFFDYFTKTSPYYGWINEQLI